MFEEVQVNKVSDEIVNQIIRLITDGKLAPGEKLPTEREMISLFGAGRSSIREALSVLEILGFIEIKKRKGIYVNAIQGSLSADPLMRIIEQDQGKIDELYELRHDLEVKGAAKAALAASDDDLVTIASCLNLEYREGEMSVDNWNKDRAFHLSVAAASHNVFRVHAVGHIFDISQGMQANIFFRLTGDREKLDAINVQHRVIYEAIQEKDSVKAERLMQEHLLWVQHKTKALQDDGMGTAL
jgi:GntR family transcriptional repressor for pyruvate dehydrogenase complex